MLQALCSNPDRLELDKLCGLLDKNEIKIAIAYLSNLVLSRVPNIPPGTGQLHADLR